MPEFKKKKDSKKDCVPKIDIFSNLNKKNTGSTYREAKLKAQIRPSDVIKRVSLISKYAEMCVGDKRMSFGIGAKQIEIDNTKLVIRSSGFTAEEWKILTQGYILTFGD